MSMTNTPHTPLTTRTTHMDTQAWEQVDFGLVDARGRAIGAEVYTAIVTFTALPETATSGYCAAPGTYFALCIQVTRNGRHYGAGQPYRYFATEAERAHATAASLAASRRRAEKKAPRPAHRFDGTCRERGACAEFAPKPAPLPRRCASCDRLLTADNPTGAVRSTTSPDVCTDCAAEWERPHPHVLVWPSEES